MTHNAMSKKLTRKYKISKEIQQSCHEQNNLQENKKSQKINQI
jgi:hypothetical protein